MKRKTVLCLLAALGLAALLADAEGVRRGVAEALALCGGTVIPSQFLFLAASSLLVSLGVGEVLAPRLEFLMWPLFRVDGAGAAALIPATVREIADMAFYGCAYLEEIRFSGSPAQWENIRIGTKNYSLTAASVAFYAVP